MRVLVDMRWARDGADANRWAFPIGPRRAKLNVDRRPHRNQLANRYALTSPTPQALHSLSQGRLARPFDVLGPHRGEEGGWTVRVWAPGAEAVTVIRDGASHPAERAAAAALFTAHLDVDEAPGPYRVQVDGVEREDPYRLGPVRPAEEYERI